MICRAIATRMARIIRMISVVGATVLAVVVLSTSLPPASPFATTAVLAAPGGNGKGNGNGGNSGAHDNKGKGNGSGTAGTGDDGAGEDEATEENSNTSAATAGGDRS